MPYRGFPVSEQTHDAVVAVCEKDNIIRKPGKLAFSVGTEGGGDVWVVTSVFLGDKGNVCRIGLRDRNGKSLAVAVAPLFQVEAALSDRNRAAAKLTAVCMEWFKKK
jgi:hypothetical protein